VKDDGINVNFLYAFETHSFIQHEAIQANTQLYWAKKSNPLVTGWNRFPRSELGRQLRLVAGLTSSNECRGADRDIYYIETGMYDHQ
jgi:hypothetical protein